MAQILTVIVEESGGVRFVYSAGLDDATALGATQLVAEALRDRIAEARVRAELEAQREKEKEE